MSPLPRNYLVMAMLTLAVAERTPQFIGAVKQFVMFPQAKFVLSKSEFDKMTSDIVAGQGIVEVDIDSSQLAIAALVEFGNRGWNVQWNPGAWKTILAYRPGAAPCTRFHLHLSVTTPRNRPARAK